MLLVTALDEVAWLLNLRGGDVAHNPVFLAYVMVTEQDATLYVDQKKVQCRSGQLLGTRTHSAVPCSSAGSGAAVYCLRSESLWACDVTCGTRSAYSF